MRLLAVCGAAVALWAAYFKLAFVGWMSDPIWYLEPARSVARGWGIVTRIMLPAQVAGFPQGFTLPVPFLHHGPVAPLVYGWAYRLLGFGEWVPYAVACLFCLGAGAAAYLLARKAAGEREALTAAALFFIHPILIEANITALTDAPFILWVTLAFSALWRGAPLAAGLLLALASTTRLAGQTYWPGFLLAAWFLRRDPRDAARLAAGLAVGLIPLMIYNYRAAGILLYSPGFYALNWSPSFPGFRSSTTYMDLTSLGAVLAYPMDFAQKAVTGPLYAVRRFLAESYAPWTMACAAFGLLTKWTGEVERFRKLLLCVAVPVFLANAVLSYGPVHYLDPLFPLLMIAAAVFLWSRPRWNTVLLGLAIAGSTALWVKDEWKERPHRARMRDFQKAIGAFARQNTKPGEVIYTDSNRTVVWDGDRPAIALTATREDAEKTFAHLPPDALLITSQRIDSSDYDGMWREAFYKGAPVMGFLPCRTLEHEGGRAVLFRRKGQCG